MTLERLIALIIVYLSKNSVNINIGQVIGKAARLVLWFLLLSHLMTLLVVGVGFDFVEIFFEKNESDKPYYQTYI